MRRLVVALIALIVAGCVSYRSVRTEQTGPEVVAEQEGRITELENRQKALLRTYAALVEEADESLARWVEEGFIDAPPMITGKVTAVDAEENVVTLTFEVDEELSSGTEFTIYAGDRYVGKVVVELDRGSWCQGYSRKAFQAKPIEVGQEARKRR